MMRIEATNSIPEDAVQKAAITGFSRDNLAAIITRQHLYDNERARGSMDAVVERFRGDINVRLVSNRVFQISYLDSDRARSQAVTQDLMTQLAETAAVEVIDPPDLPQRAVRSNRVSLVGLGLTSGTLIGAFVVLIRRRRPVAI
jgi:uncharacterized protein involved in exopolysaccharide biosynthesis